MKKEHKSRKQRILNLYYFLYHHLYTDNYQYEINMQSFHRTKGRIPNGTSQWKWGKPVYKAFVFPNMEKNKPKYDTLRNTFPRTDLFIVNCVSLCAGKVAPSWLLWVQWTALRSGAMLHCLGEQAFDGVIQQWRHTPLGQAWPWSFIHDGPDRTLNRPELQGRNARSPKVGPRP